MSSNSPTLAFAIACFSVIFYFAGLEVLSFIPIAIVGFLFVVAMFAPPEQHPVSGRVAAFMALNLALLPIYLPIVQEVRYDQLEARRAAQTADMYRTIDEAMERLVPLIDEYYERHRRYPELDGETVLPYADAQGRIQEGNSMEDLRAPRDPFHPARNPMRWVAVRDRGVLLASVGQSGVKELGLPGVPMDGPPAHPLARFAQTGDDPRWKIYDPTNGALGLGDVVRYHGRVPWEEAMEPLFNAWDLAHRRSEFRPEDVYRPRHRAPGDERQSVRDAAEAVRLLGQEEYLAALALASRAHRLRPPQTIWRDEEYTVDLTRGMALYHLAAYREAADALIDYVAVVPNDAQAHYYLGAALHRGGDRTSALVHLSAAAQIDPGAGIRHTAQQHLTIAQGGQMPPYPAPAGIDRGQ